VRGSSFRVAPSQQTRQHKKEKQRHLLRIRVGTGWIAKEDHIQ
jgi:hypothetical protein